MHELAGADVDDLIGDRRVQVESRASRELDEPSMELKLPSETVPASSNARCLGLAGVPEDLEDAPGSDHERDGWPSSPLGSGRRH